MAPPPEPSDSSIELKASYESPSSANDFSCRLITRASLDKASEEGKPALFSKEKTAYLSELRSSVKRMQGDINMFLTAKMEEDKRSAARNGHLNGKGKDEVEEENYGEEDIEEG